jgi:putative transposase
MRRTTPLEVSEEDRTLLLSWLGSPRLSERLRLRARIVVASAGGQGARALARDLRVSLETIYLWRRRYAEQGIDGLRSLSSPGRHSQVDRRRTELILRAGRARRPGAKTPSVAAVARAGGVSRATVRRLWDRHGIRDRSPHRRTKTPQKAEIGPCTIIGIYIDPPWRVLARVAPTGAPRVGRAARAPHSPRRSERASAASALLTALAAFGSDALPRGTANEAASARLKEVLAGLSRIGGGAALEVLAGPRPPQTASVAADAPRARDGSIHLVRARTHGAWLTRATDWLLAASGAQEEALAGVFGHLMDYFASWRDGSAPFIWTPGPPPSPPLRTA